MNNFILHTATGVYYERSEEYLTLIIPVKNVGDSCQVELSKKVSSSYKTVFQLIAREMDLYDFGPDWSGEGHRMKNLTGVGPKQLWCFKSWSPLGFVGFSLIDSCISLWNQKSRGYISTEYVIAVQELEKNRPQVASIVWTDDAISIHKNKELFN